MTVFQNAFRKWRRIMKRLKLSRAISLLAVFLMSLTGFAQNAQSPVLKTNQTLGYGKHESVLLTYTQSFDCVDQPSDDLNFNGIPAASDPAEFQVPICQAGIQPTQDPAGLNFSANDPTEPLYVLIPMFSSDNDQNPDDAISCTGVVTGTNCGPALGSTLISLFGALPEAFKAKPLVYTQCPGPLQPGTCTMHASRVDLGLALEQLGLLPPPAANYFVPLPNHSHLVLDIDVNLPQIWWEVEPVLVMNSSDWPTQDGSSGITSVKQLLAAEKSGDAIQVPSNFFLFFSTKTMQGMNHMH
jgi:hypothetical protein